MNQEALNEWIAALRSGIYAQGRRVLRRAEAGGPNLYCCLGILCDLSQARGFGEWQPPVGPSTYYQFESAESKNLEMSYPPATIRHLLGLELIEWDTLISNCSSRNDSGWTFDEIARWLDETYGETDESTK